MDRYWRSSHLNEYSWPSICLIIGSPQILPLLKFLVYVTTNIIITLYQFFFAKVGALVPGEWMSLSWTKTLMTLNTAYHIYVDCDMMTLHVNSLVSLYKVPCTCNRGAAILCTIHVKTLVSFSPHLRCCSCYTWIHWCRYTKYHARTNRGAAILCTIHVKTLVSSYSSAWSQRCRYTVYHTRGQYDAGDRMTYDRWRYIDYLSAKQGRIPESTHPNYTPTNLRTWGPKRERNNNRLHKRILYQHHTTA